MEFPRPDRHFSGWPVPIALSISCFRATAFFTDVWGLTLVARDNAASHLRGTGPFHHILALHRRPRAEILRINLLAADRAGVDALHARAGEQGAVHGVSDLTAPAELDRPGGGYGFAFRDGEGRNLAIVADIATHSDTDDVPDRPRKLAHVVLNAEAPAQSVALFTDLLGFRVSDRTRMHNFLRCGDTAAGRIDHHNIAIGNGGGADGAPGDTASTRRRAAPRAPVRPVGPRSVPAPG